MNGGSEAMNGNATDGTGTADARAKQAVRPFDPDDAIDAALKRAVDATAAETRDPAFGWARLERAIAAELAARKTPVRKTSATVSPLWRVAAALLAAIALGQGAVIVMGAPDRFVTAGVDTVAVEMGGASAIASFRPGVTAKGMTAALDDHAVRIVDGPSALGLYRLLGEADALDALARSPVIEAITQD